MFGISNDKIDENVTANTSTQDHTMNSFTQDHTINSSLTLEKDIGEVQYFDSLGYPVVLSIQCGALEALGNIDFILESKIQSYTHYIQNTIEDTINETEKIDDTIKHEIKKIPTDYTQNTTDDTIKHDIQKKMTQTKQNQTFCSFASFIIEAHEIWLEYECDNAEEAVIETIAQLKDKNISVENFDIAVAVSTLQEKYPNLINCSFHISEECLEKFGDTKMTWLARNVDDSPHALSEFLRLCSVNDIECNIPNKLGNTPLMIAALSTSFKSCDTSGCIIAMKALLSSGVSLDVSNSDGFSVMSIISCKGSSIATKLLLSQNDCLKQLEYQDRRGATPLIIASYYGHSKIVKALLNVGANVDATDDTGATSLILASRFGHTSVVLELLSSQADISIQNKVIRPKNGNTTRTPHNLGASALVWSSFNGHPRIVSMLLKAGAPPDSKSVQGCSALSYAARGGTRGHLECARHLLDFGASIHLRFAGVDSLTFAAYHNHKTIVEVLIDFYKRQIQKNEKGCIQIADEKVKITLARFALPALMVSSHRCNKDVIRVLMGAGVSPEMIFLLENQKNRTSDTSNSEMQVPLSEQMKVFRLKAAEMTSFVNRSELKFFRMHNF